MAASKKSKTKQKKTLVLVDGHALAYRAHFAFAGQNLTDEKGNPTETTFGFFRMLAKLIADRKPSHFVLCFDPGRDENPRYTMYKDYKANRPPMPDALRRQIIVTEPLPASVQALVPRDMPMTIDAATTFYLHPEGPASRPSILLGMSYTAEEPGFKMGMSDDWLPDLTEAMEHRAPALLEVGMAHGWSGLYEDSPDHNAMIGEVAGVFGKRSPYANLDAWVKRFHARPAYKRALERGGTYHYAK